MNEYYGVPSTPNDSFLKHYGIKGMKWGVRKALEKRGIKRDKALRRQFNKANEKLIKLNKLADVNEQKRQQIKYAKRAGVGLGISTTLGLGGLHVANRIIKNREMGRAIMYPDDLAISPASYNEQLAKHNAEFAKKYSAAKKAAAVIGLGGVGYSGYAGTRSLLAKYRTSPKGHAKAVAKRNAFRKEMDKAFAKTRYAKRRRG